MDFLVAHGEALLFYVFASMAIIGAIYVVAMRNPVYGAIGLLVSFVAVAALFLLRHAEFLAVVQLFVYGGGIMVLFLFVIMLVNLHRLRETGMLVAHYRFAIVLALIMVGLFIYIFLNVAVGPANPSPDALVMVDGEVMGNSEAVAWKLYREYLLPFEIASLFLLVAMIGAVVLGRRS